MVAGVEVTVSAFKILGIILVLLASLICLSIILLKRMESKTRMYYGARRKAERQCIVKIVEIDHFDEPEQAKPFITMD